MSVKVLIVDDEPDLCEIIKFNLEEQGMPTDMVESGEEALKLDLNQYGVILLDVMMNGMSGHELLSIIRNNLGLEIPVVFISAMTSDDDLEKGYQLGANDYIRKPFSVREVVLKVKALIERFGKEYALPSNHKVEPNIDPFNKVIKIGNRAIEFTRTEYNIFHLLFEQEGKVYSRDEIMQHIWNEHPNILGRTVDVNITRIRKKLGSFGKCIVTRSGYGYYFDRRKIATA